MTIVVKFWKCGDGLKNKIDHACLQTSANAWEAITEAAATATTFPQNALWCALDPNLPGKSSAVKVAVQAHSLALLDLGPLNEWRRLARVVAQGALALFKAGTDGWDDPDVPYEPFRTVGNRSEVIVTEAARPDWDAAMAAHERMLQVERFESFTPAQLGGLFLLTHTPDNWVKATRSFGYDYWWLRVLHLSIERNVDLKVCDFALVGPRPCDRSEAALRMAQRQIATIVALRVAIFYKKRHGANAPELRVTRHDLEQAKRKWLQRPQTPKKRARAEGVADVVSAAMNAASLQALRPVREVLRLANEQRSVLLMRIAELDRLACTAHAWQRVVADESTALQTRLMGEIAELTRAGRDATQLRESSTAAVVQRGAIARARSVAATTGLRLEPADSIWASTHASVTKLVAVGAGARARASQTVYVRDAAEFKRLFGGGAGGACGHHAAASGARAEQEVLADRLLALLALEFRLRSSAATRCPLPLELRAASGDGSGEVHREAKKLRVAELRHTETFASAVSRALCHAIEVAFGGCLRLVSSEGSGYADTARSPRQWAALSVVNRMLTIAACHDGLVPSDDDGDEAAIVAYDRETHALTLLDLERVVVQKWPAARALADVATECEAWLRNPRKLVPLTAPHGPWWVACSPSGLAVAPEHKQAALDALGAPNERWWDAWPPTREQITTRETIATAIKWGSRASPAFLGIDKPDQFLGTPPFYGFVD